MEREGLSDSDAFGIGLAHYCEQGRDRVTLIEMLGHLAMIQHVLQSAGLSAAAHRQKSNEDIESFIGAMAGRPPGGSKH